MNGRRLFFFAAAAAVLAATFFLTGCVSSGPQFTIPEAPPSGRSVVYFYRANKLLTNTTSPGIIHNKKKVLSLMVSGGFWKYYINPGVHVFEPQQFGLYKKVPLTLTNDKPGQTYYVELVVNIGYIGFHLRSEPVGLAGISECYELGTGSNGQSGTLPAKTDESATDNVAVPDSKEKAQAEILPKLEPAQVSPATGPAKIHVVTTPENARIRIMNIKPKFHQGIELKPGKYHIEMSAEGYFTESKWVALAKGEALNLNFTLLAK